MTIRDTYCPTAPCPCNSGNPANACCLRSPGVWQKLPAITLLPPPHTGLGNPNCYLQCFNDCSGDISKEHYVSDTVLAELEHLNTVKIAGLPWIPREQFKKVGKSGLSSKILCRRHNSSLSPLDAEAGRLVRTIGKFDSEFNTANPKPEIAIFCGENIERWMLKTVCGMVAAKQVSQDGNPVASKILETWPELLVDTTKWPPAWGLYATLPDKQIYHSRSFAFVAKTRPDNYNVLAAEFVLHGIQFSLVLGKPNQPAARGIYRPRTLRFSNDAVEKLIEISWESSIYNEYLLFTRVGKYDGPPSDWPEWARNG
jgi:hypothetical protein